MTIRKKVDMSTHGYTNKTTLAKPWILPLIIVAGLAAAWAAPWTFMEGTPVSYIGKTLVPLLAQAIVSSYRNFFYKCFWISHRHLGREVSNNAIRSASARRLSTSTNSDLGAKGRGLYGHNRYADIQRRS